MKRCAFAGRTASFSVRHADLPMKRCAFAGRTASFSVRHADLPIAALSNMIHDPLMLAGENTKLGCVKRGSMTFSTDMSFGLISTHYEKEETR